jgi:hypothetical protein
MRGATGLAGREERAGDGKRSRAGSIVLRWIQDALRLSKGGVQAGRTIPALVLRKAV